MTNIKVPQAVMSGKGESRTATYCKQDVPDIREMADQHAATGIENADSIQNTIYILTIQLQAAMRLLEELDRKDQLTSGIRVQLNQMLGEWRRGKVDRGR